MVGVRLEPGRGELRGSVSLPSSKSLTNRALIASAVAGGGTVVSPLDCDDTRILAAALAEAGWPVNWGTEIEIGERNVPGSPVRLDLAESGTGSRLILALLAASPGSSVIDGAERLRERPMAPLIDSLTRLGARLNTDDGFLPIRIDGLQLEGGAVEMEPGVSSQFVSALVMAAPLMVKGLDIVVTGPLPSAPYLDLTVDVLRAFGGEVEVSDDHREWVVSTRPLRPTRFAVEGDWSAAAFILSAAAVAGGTIDIGPLDPTSRQGDRAVVSILADAGLEADWTGDRLVANGPVNAPIVADLQNTPDLFPALAAVAACGPAGSRFTGLEHLKHKESDRLSVMVENLGQLGARFEFRGPELAVEEGVRTVSESARSATSAGDHRIAMAMAVTALAAGPIELDDPSCVTKSFPQFWEVWSQLLSAPEGEGITP